MEFGLAVVIVNALGAFSAAVVNMWAAWRTNGWVSRVFLGIAGLSLTYMFSYAWLSFHMESAADWSAVMRPISIITWGVAWAIEPIVLVRYINAKAVEIQRSAVQKIVDVRHGNGDE